VPTLSRRVGGMSDPRKVSSTREGRESVENKGHRRGIGESRV